ncbi:amidase domain-containing protein [Streptomyces sp. W16]|uniref:amidase domain-containing protein n=1 Tax=Streptomyces sp. W16 TaxID=3076631 RepID=UPI00295AAA09|nr:amidase domain-containing protein [Streptomyces sp. W16]MDV9177363.1 amidase domain-containing protein [Streptomyces sp. W16]
MKVDDTTVDGGTATLQLTGYTSLRLPFTPQEVEEGAPEYEELSSGDTADTTPLPDSSASDAAKSGTSAAYGYSKMVAYAARYWDHHNDAYRTYGNDCTHFISQAMPAGGWGTKGGALIQLTYHTSDTHNKSLRKLLSDHPRAWRYAHRT